MSNEPAKGLVLLDVDARGVATATLNRPELGNAYNEDLLGELIALEIDVLHKEVVGITLCRPLAEAVARNAVIWCVIRERPDTTRINPSTMSTSSLRPKPPPMRWLCAVTLSSGSPVTLAAMAWTLENT